MNISTNLTKIYSSCLVPEIKNTRNDDDDDGLADVWITCMWAGDLQSSSHVTDKLDTIIKEERENLSHKIRTSIILQTFQLSKLIIQKALHSQNNKQIKTSNDLTKPITIFRTKIQPLFALSISRFSYRRLSMCPDQKVQSLFTLSIARFSYHRLSMCPDQRHVVEWNGFLWWGSDESNLLVERKDVVTILHLQLSDVSVHGVEREWSEETEIKRELSFCFFWTGFDLSFWKIANP